MRGPQRLIVSPTTRIVKAKRRLIQVNAALSMGQQVFSSLVGSEMPICMLKVKPLLMSVSVAAPVAALSASRLPVCALVCA